MIQKKRATLVDVAAKAGVSKMTASRALRGAGDVSEANITKVRKAAKDIGYVGNHLAGSLSSKRSDLIGAVIPSLSNIVFAEVLSGISQRIYGSGMQPVFGITDYDPEKEYDVIRNMLSWNPAGLIVTGLDQPSDTRRLLEDADIPIVQIMDTDGDPVDACVGFSHRAAGRDMAEHLLASGKSRFAFVGSNLAKDTRAQKRLSGFEAALSKAGQVFVATEKTEAASTIQTGMELTSRILAQHPQTDCIYYSNDDLAAGGAYHAMAAKIAVPDHLALVGFNGLDLTQNLPIKLASTLTPRLEIGQRAAEIVLASFNKNADPIDRHVTFTPKIV